MWKQKTPRTLSDTLFAGSVFMGVDSFVGPVYIGAGYAQGGHLAMVFYLTVHCDYILLVGNRWFTAGLIFIGLQR